MAIEINTAAEFADIKNWTDRGSSDAPLDIIITQDLDFSEISDFTGLGSTVLYAKIDGQGHTIRNIVVTTSSSYLMYLGGACSVKNIKFENNNITFTSSGRIISFNGGGTVRDVIFSNDNIIHCGGYFYTISATAASNISRVAISGTYYITSTDGYFYGLSVGGGRSYIKNCYITATIYSKAIYGFNIYDNNEFYNCFMKCNLINNTTSKMYVYPFYLRYSQMYYCYACNTIQNTVTSGNTIYGVVYYGANTSATMPTCYFDNTILTGAIDDSRQGQPTENLKSAEWLRSQGWAV